MRAEGVEAGLGPIPTSENNHHPISRALHVCTVLLHPSLYVVLVDQQQAGRRAKTTRQRLLAILSTSRGVERIGTARSVYIQRFCTRSIVLHAGDDLE